MVLPIITDKGLTQQISLVISIETPYGKKADVEYLAPRLTDAYLQELYGRLGDGQDMQGGVIDIQAVKERLAVVTDKVLGKELVHDILLQVVHQAKR